MKSLALVLALAAAGCSKKHLAECDAFQATVDKLAKCKSLPDSAKDSIQASGKQLKEMFDAIDQAGGIDSAPKDLQEQLRDTCKSQNAAIVEAYSKLAADCLK
jgi:hypothetical protein